MAIIKDRLKMFEKTSIMNENGMKEKKKKNEEEMKNLNNEMLNMR